MFGKGSKSGGRPTRSPDERGGISLAGESAGCRDRRSTIGSSGALLSGGGGCDGRAGKGRGKVINHRRRYGDWEGDTIVGKGRRSALVTLVERKSGYVRLARIDNMKSATTIRAARRRLKDLPPSLRRSLTLDNGKEFAQHATLTKRLGLEVYFADPSAPWQRGTNENTNGLVRDFFPKGTDLVNIPEHRFTKVQQLLNDRPRKRLGYRTPNEVLASRLSVAIET
jgi:IS30 family transposase